MNEYFTVEKCGSYHNVVFAVRAAFEAGKIGRPFTGKLGAGQVVSSGGTVGFRPLSDTVSMSVEPMGDGTYAINDADTTIYASFNAAIEAAKLALIGEFK